MKKNVSVITMTAYMSILALFPAVPIAFAAPTPTPSVSGKPSPTPAVTLQPTVSATDIRESLQDRLRKAAEEQSGVAGQIFNTNEKRAIVGTLKDLTNNTLTIQLKAGGTKLAALTEKTVFVRKGKTAPQSDLVIGDYTIAMGYMNGNNLLEARRVVAVEKPTERTPRKIFIGTVTAVDAKRKSFTVVSDRPAELGGPETLSVIVSKSIDIDLSKLKADMKMIIVGVPDEKTPSSLTLTAYKTL